MTTEQSEYRTTAGATLYMTDEQAGRWDCGDITDDDAASIRCLVPTTTRKGLPTTWEGSLAECEQQHPGWYADMIEDRALRPLQHCQIEWFEDRKSGRGYLIAKFEDDSQHECEWPGQPINASSDSHAIAEWVAAELSLDVLSVEHDKQYVHATMVQR